MREEREHSLEAIAQARRSGARLAPCCAALGLDPRTVQRWLQSPESGDQRRGPTTSPKNKLSEAERGQVIAIATSPPCVRVVAASSFHSVRGRTGARW